MVTVGTRRLMRKLGYRLWIAVLFGSQVARVSKRGPFGLQLPLGGVGYELVLSGGWIEGDLIELLLLVRCQLGGLDVDLAVRMNEAALV